MIHINKTYQLLFIRTAREIIKPLTIKVDDKRTRTKSKPFECKMAAATEKIQVAI